ncbi:MAG: ATP-binding protein [Acidobacteriota bacterium]|nr:ATP-binding protein [Acidobacteriota bacterium]
MTIKESKNEEDRVLVLMPTGRDAALVCSTLEAADIFAQVCTNLSELKESFFSGAGAVLIAEEALTDAVLEHFTESFNRQPVWSDVPVVIFANSGQNSENLLIRVGTRFNATIVERPIRITMLISAVRGALRAREKQYQTRDLLNKLEEADRQKDLFLATLSHELRTPLNSMLGWIQLLRNKSNPAVDVQHALEVVERNAKAQSEIVSDILFVSRVVTGKLELKTEIIDLLPVIQSAIETITPSVEVKEIHLQTSFDLNISKIEGDADRLQQVFLNLLSNAIKFTPRGGRINIRATNKGSNVEIEVKDTGQGIGSEFLPFVFERFRQADNSFTRQIGGLGLGLAIVQHLVELHGGTVGAKSEGENRGAVFTISLPSVAPQQPPFAANRNQNGRFQKPENAESLKDVRLLLVEDDEDSREMLKIMFGQYGMKIVAAASAAEALDAIRQFQPHVLISDVGLPGEDGYELIRRIRLLPPEQGGTIPAVALTGYASLQDRALALAAGYQEHLSKPVDIEKLTELVKNLVMRNEIAALE